MIIRRPCHQIFTPLLTACRLVRWTAWVLMLILAAGCAQSEVPPTATPSAPATAPAAPEQGPGLPAPVAGRQLVVWLPPFSGVAGDEQAGEVLDDAFYQFEQSHPGVNVDVHVKAEFGAAGMATFLRSAQQVAPSTLPDLVLIRTQQLWQLVDLGMAPALQSGEYPAIDDFFPFGLEAVTYRDQVHGVPFAADILVLVYDPALTPDPPRTWDDTLAQGQPLLFAGGPAETALNLPALAQYAGAGGELREDGTLSMPGALEAWFEFLLAAQAQELIQPRTLEMPTSDAVWRAYAPQPEGLALILAADALGQPSLLVDFALAPIPTQTGHPVTAGPIWALAILTTDPEQRRLAAELVATLLTPEVQGVWSRLAHYLPSRRSALAVWTTGDGDPALLEGLLEAAVALPNGRPFAEFARRIQLAQLGILRGELSSADAVQLVRAGE